MKNQTKHSKEKLIQNNRSEIYTKLFNLIKNNLKQQAKPNYIPMQQTNLIKITLLYILAHL